MDAIKWYQRGSFEREVRYTMIPNSATTGQHYELLLMVFENNGTYIMNSIQQVKSGFVIEPKNEP